MEILLLQKKKILCKDFYIVFYVFEMFQVTARAIHDNVALY